MEINSQIKRIKRQRTKGWRMPENTIYVGRGTRFGNSFSKSQRGIAFTHCSAPLPIVTLSGKPSLERCLDLYLCPRAMKRRLNIDPESLVPSIPKAADLRPFPTARAVHYETPHGDGTDPPMVRCLAVSPDPPPHPHGLLSARRMRRAIFMGQGRCSTWISRDRRPCARS